MEIAIPPQVDNILKALAGNGFEAYLVGGCVRDSLLGNSPKDWDIATSARPEETERALNEYKVVETGLKHGTVTVISGGMPVEVTTYRIDGSYSDGRHPDSVEFTGNLKEDLARRDFTVNALAYCPGSGVVDCFGGIEDLKNKVIRCVGEADRRFREDGLRILRALRFSSVLGFRIEERTAESLLNNRALLDLVANERINAEFTKLLCGKNAADILRKFRDVIAQFIPEIRPCFEFEQHNPHHVYDVWEHTLHCVDAVGQTPVLRLTMLLHDIGKPLCYTCDEKGVGHFYGHAAVGFRTAQTVLARLRYDKRTAGTVLMLIQYHDLPLRSDARYLRRQLNRFGEENLRLLFRVAAADTMGKNPEHQSRLETLTEAEEQLNMILSQKQCFSLANLSVNGKDLMEAGIPRGTEIGRTLQILLDAVIDGKCYNTRDNLLKYARTLKDRHQI